MDIILRKRLDMLGFLNHDINVKTLKGWENIRSFLVSIDDAYSLAQIGDVTLIPGLFGIDVVIQDINTRNLLQITRLTYNDFDSELPLLFNKEKIHTKPWVRHYIAADVEGDITLLEEYLDQLAEDIRLSKNDPLSNENVIEKNQIIQKWQKFFENNIMDRAVLSQNYRLFEEKNPFLRPVNYHYMGSEYAPKFSESTLSKSNIHVHNQGSMIRILMDKNENFSLFFLPKTAEALRQPKRALYQNKYLKSGNDFNLPLPELDISLSGFYPGKATINFTNSVNIPNIDRFSRGASIKKVTTLDLSEILESSYSYENKRVIATIAVKENGDIAILENGYIVAKYNKSEVLSSKKYLSQDNDSALQSFIRIENRSSNYMQAIQEKKAYHFYDFVMNLPQKDTEVTFRYDSSPIISYRQNSDTLDLNQHLKKTIIEGKKFSYVDFVSFVSAKDDFQGLNFIFTSPDEISHFIAKDGKLVNSSEFMVVIDSLDLPYGTYMYQIPGIHIKSFNHNQFSPKFNPVSLDWTSQDALSDGLKRIEIIAIDEVNQIDKFNFHEHYNEKNLFSKK